MSYMVLSLNILTLHCKDLYTQTSIAKTYWYNILPDFHSQLKGCYGRYTYL